MAHPVALLLLGKQDQNAPRLLTVPVPDTDLIPYADGYDWPLQNGLRYPTIRKFPHSFIHASGVKGGSQTRPPGNPPPASTRLPAAVKPRARAQVSWPAPIKPTLMVAGSRVPAAAAETQ